MYSRKNFFVGKILFFILLLSGISGYGQNFSLQVTPTAATCAAPGSLSFSVSGEAPGIPVTYNVYLMPDIANPVAQTTTTSVTGLAPGSYYVTATQNLPGGVITATGQARIRNNTQLAATIINTTQLCIGEGGGSFTVNVTSGVAATYEIYWGPTIRPPQTSPVFENLEQGLYWVKITDICGNQIDLYPSVEPGIVFWMGLLSVQPEFPSCNEVMTKLLLIADPNKGEAPIPYPLTVKYTIHNGSSDTVIDQVITSGDPWYLEVFQILPFVAFDELVDVDVMVYHPCGQREYTAFGSPPGQVPIAIPKIQATGGYGLAGCAQKFLKVNVANFSPPYTINFTTAPAGFNPSAANPQYPGPYTDTDVQFGSEAMPVPVGPYTAVITDACGQSRDVLFMVTPTMQVEADAFNYDCVNNLGYINAQLVSDEAPVVLDKAILTQAPAEYEATTPLDVSTYISDNDVLELPGLPPGVYWFNFSDECGNTLTRSIRVPENVPSVMIGDKQPDCSPGLGTVTISTHNPPLSGVKIMIAPPEFPYPLPYDASFNINSQGVFYMDGLPPGDYRFMGIDVCYNPDKPRYYVAKVEGYTVNKNNLQVIPGCNTYDIILNYESNAAGETFWIQKQLSNGSWGHPETDYPYTEGSVPNNTTAIKIQSQETLTANGWSGKYRILRYHQAYARVTGRKECIAVIHNFELYQGLQLLEANILSCPGDPISLEVVTNAVLPAQYTIIRRNNIPYLIQNGEDNIFTGLTEATYTVTISDSCGQNITVDITTQDATPLVVVNDPGTLFTCDVGNDGEDTFDLSLQNAGILGSQDPDEYTVTYHATQEEADAGTGVLPNTIVSGPATIYARVIRNDSPVCHETIAFALQLYQSPVLNITTPAAFCEGQTVTLTAPAGYAGYRWSNGAITEQIAVGTSGDYTVVVTNEHGCESSQTVTVVASPVPEIKSIDVIDFAESNTITVNIKPNDVPMYPEYSLDGVTYQQSNIFENLLTGEYTVFVRDSFRCGFDQETVYVLDYPKFFTPNGDGTNDKWRIKFSTIQEPNMIVHVFDRFGKLVYSFDANDEGWDGSFEGAPLPATDYWFIVKRQSGREYRGHFSLVR